MVAAAEMRNRFVGNVGDFGKYGLLRAISCLEEPVLKLGIVCYLTLSDSESKDARPFKYLEQTGSNQAFFRACDATLYDGLAAIVSSRVRSVQAIYSSALFPDGLVLYDSPLTDLDGHQSRISRLEQRSLWLADANKATEGCDIVYLDPDNGVRSTPAHTEALSNKHAYHHELKAFVQRQQTVVVYHHPGRRGSVKDQVRDRLFDLRGYFEAEIAPFGLLYRRGACRSFLILPSERHHTVLVERLQRFLDSSWSQHFEAITCETPGTIDHLKA